jgi:hypothetical protein
LINDVYPNYITLGRSSSYQVKGWELGQHGDVGANGSRGSLLIQKKKIEYQNNCWALSS